MHIWHMLATFVAQNELALGASTSSDELAEAVSTDIDGLDQNNILFVLWHVVNGRLNTDS